MDILFEVGRNEWYLGLLRKYLERTILVEESFSTCHLSAFPRLTLRIRSLLARESRVLGRAPRFCGFSSLRWAPDYRFASSNRNTRDALLARVETLHLTNHSCPWYYIPGNSIFIPARKYWVTRARELRSLDRCRIACFLDTSDPHDRGHDSCPP